MTIFGFSVLFVVTIFATLYLGLVAALSINSGMSSGSGKLGWIVLIFIMSGLWNYLFTNAPFALIIQ